MALTITEQQVREQLGAYLTKPLEITSGTLSTQQTLSATSLSTGGLSGSFIIKNQVQINILNDLEKTIKADGTLVTKEYVKGRQNVYTHPAITEYNKTANGANQTVQTLMKIITTLRDENSDSADELMAFIRGD